MLLPLLILRQWNWHGDAMRLITHDSCLNVHKQFVFLIFM
jgi:hypothetical protein